LNYTRINAAQMVAFQPRGVNRPGAGTPDPDGFVVEFHAFLIDLRQPFMEIVLNGTATEVPDGATAAELVEQLGLTGKRIAMEVNREILPRSRYAEQPLAPGDQVEIVHAIGGGQGSR